MLSGAALMILKWLQRKCRVKAASPWAGFCFLHSVFSTLTTAVQHTGREAPGRHVGTMCQLKMDRLPMMGCDSAFSFKEFSVLLCGLHAITLPPNHSLAHSLSKLLVTPAQSYNALQPPRGEDGQVSTSGPLIALPPSGSMGGLR